MQFNQGLEKLAKLAFEATSDGVWAWEILTGKGYFSPQYYTMLGYEPDEFPATYDSWFGLLHPDEAEDVEKAIKSHIDSKSESYEVEFRLRTKEENYIWIMGRGRVVERDGSGNPLILVGSHIDIDAQKRALDKLATYQELLQQMVRERTRKLEQTTSLLEATLDAIPDVLGIQDDQHRMIRYNNAGYSFLQKTPEEVTGKRCYELLGRDKECERCATSICYTTKKPASLVRYEETLDLWLDVRAYPILDEDKNLVRVIEHLRDITAEKKAEMEKQELQEQLLNAKKMESIGTLAGGIAHDFNNLLMGIQGRVSLMGVEERNSQNVTDHLKAVEEYIEAASTLTKQLLGFARRGKYKAQPLDINKLVCRSAEMFGRTRKEIVVSFELFPQPLVVEADYRQLEQVLLNFYINAWQAMPNGGTLNVQTSIATISTTLSPSQVLPPGEFCKISIIDSGIGMDEKTCQRIFEPFFTTKKKERGTGLGLASSYGIIKNHGGTIEVKSEPGVGSIFTLLLPFTDKKMQTHEVENKETLKYGDSTILLVDDEQMILDVGEAMLTSLGYNVITAKGGEEAIAAIELNPGTFQLIILDMIMPGVDGSMVFDALLEIEPELPVLLSTGYSMDGKATKMMEKGCKDFIQKPFTLAELSHRVEKLIQSQ